MKAHFKYSFLSAAHDRGIIFAVIFAMNFVFIVLGTLGLLPFPAQVVAVSLGSVAIAVMAIVNIVSDIGIIRRMLSYTKAYLTALVPAQRHKMLLSNVVAIAIIDIVTMAVAIIGMIWMSLILADTYSDFSSLAGGFALEASLAINALGFILILITGYLLLTMFIVSCIVVKRSLFYQKRSAGVLTALLAIGGVYLWSLLHFVLAPFGTVTRYGWHGMFFEITLGRTGLFAYAIYTILCAVVLFVINSRLMERKLNL